MTTIQNSFYRLGLTGYPLGHSLSPRLHAAALSSTGLEGEYLVYPVPPNDVTALAQLLGRLRVGELHGLNVTIPHKQAVIPLLDDLTPTARTIGAVNTIHARDGRLIGDNTDAAGFMADLTKFIGPETPAASPAHRTALVLGAGGSARAVVYALSRQGWNMVITARRVEQAQAMAAGFRFPVSDTRVSGIEFTRERIAALAAGLALIINTTPIGMSPQVDSSPWPQGLAFPPVAVYDLVYNPHETLLVRQARAAGLHAQTGLGMLVEQAALAFEIWTGRAPSRAAMFAAANTLG